MFQETQVWQYVPSVSITGYVFLLQGEMLPTIHYKEPEKYPQRKGLSSKLKTVQFPFPCSILDFPGCKSVTARFSNLMIYRSVSSSCWLPDSGWHLLPSLEIGRVLQVCTGRGQVSREQKSFDHEQMNRDEALNFSNTMDVWSTSKLSRTACTLQKYQQKSNN